MALWQSGWGLYSLPSPYLPFVTSSFSAPWASQLDSSLREFLRGFFFPHPIPPVLGNAPFVPCRPSFHPGPHYLLPPIHEVIHSRRGATATLPCVRWSKVEPGELRETLILITNGLHARVATYRFRVALPAYPALLTDVSLVLSELRPNDSGIYRCEVQHGIDDSSDAIEVKVKGVVFLYREGSARYAFSFAVAQEACARIGARIATPEQLYAAYLGGYEQCDAGWLSDQTVRYPIQTPREACYGDMDGFPGVRNYGVVDPEDLYDVYCYAEDLNGELFLGAPPDKLTLEEARAYCRERGAEIATTGQLYAAWDGGLDRCSPGWLADGRPCFPNKHSRFNVYCFRDAAQPSATPEVSLPASDPGSDGLEAVITVTETLEELQLPPEAVESESRGAIYSIPVMEDGGGGSSTPEDPASGARDSVVPPTGSSDEDQMLDEEEAEEEEEEEAAEDEDLWAWPSEFRSPVPTEPEAEDSLSQASPPARAVLQPGASPPPEGQSGTPRPPRVRGPPTETLPTPREGTLASPPSSTLVGEEIEGPELSEVPRGESEETGSSEDATSLPPAIQAPEGTRELEAPSEEDSGRTIPAGTSVQAQPVLPTDSASRGGVAVAPSSGDCVPSPCHNGGTCLEEEEGVRCLCLPGYGGDLCDVGLRFCSPGWDAFQGACYRHFSTRRSWEEAETQCRMYGAHLASISTPEEQDFINNRYREYQWIGLNDRTIEGDFLWSDGVPLRLHLPRDSQELPGLQGSVDRLPRLCPLPGRGPSRPHHLPLWLGRKLRVLSYLRSLEERAKRQGAPRMPPPCLQPYRPPRGPESWKPPLKRTLGEPSPQGPPCRPSRCCPLTAPAEVEWPWPPHQVTLPRARASS
uniref:Brevican core protein n=1 Tax=Spermophilus dauricus TaxID=99837 RepID=A0A8C9QMM4_SPEDA